MIIKSSKIYIFYVYNNIIFLNFVGICLRHTNVKKDFKVKIKVLKGKEKQVLRLRFSNNVSANNVVT